MANKLKRCATCNADIAASAKACPQCGAKNKKAILKKWWFWVIVIALVGAIGANMGSGKKAVQSAVNTVASQPTTAPEPIVVDVDTLEDALSSNALSASNTYKGQYVELTGKLSVIDSSGAYFSLKPLDGRFSLTGVQCKITKEQQAIVASFTRDQEVTVVGTITAVGEIMGYSLTVESIKE